MTSNGSMGRPAQRRSTMNDGTNNDDDSDIELEPLMMQEDQKRKSNNENNSDTIGNRRITPSNARGEYKNGTDLDHRTIDMSATTPASASPRPPQVNGGDEEVGGEEAPHCRICYGDHLQERLVVPCACAGSMRWIHISCLNRWRVTNPARAEQCEICHERYVSSSWRHWPRITQWLSLLLLVLPMCLLALIASGEWAAGGGGMNDPHTRAMCASPTTVHHILEECSHSTATFFMLPNATIEVAVAAGATHSHARLPLLHLSDPSTLKPSSAQHMRLHIGVSSIDFSHNRMTSTLTFRRPTSSPSVSSTSSSSTTSTPDISSASIGTTVRSLEGGHNVIGSVDADRILPSSSSLPSSSLSSSSSSVPMVSSMEGDVSTSITFTPLFDGGSESGQEPSRCINLATSPVVVHSRVRHLSSGLVQDTDYTSFVNGSTPTTPSGARAARARDFVCIRGYSYEIMDMLPFRVRRHLVSLPVSIKATNGHPLLAIDRSATILHGRHYVGAMTDPVPDDHDEVDGGTSDGNIGNGDISHTVITGRFDDESTLANDTLTDWLGTLPIMLRKGHHANGAAQAADDFMSSTGAEVPVSWRYVLNVMRLAMHPNMLPDDIVAAIQPPFTFTTTTNSSANTNSNGNRSSSSTPSVAMTSHGRLTYCSSDVSGSGAICVQPSTICVVAAHTASAYHHIWLPPRCYGTQRFVFALLWIMPLVSFLCVVHQRWQVLMGPADRRRREYCRLLTLMIVTIQAILGIVLTDDDELAFLYRIFLMMVISRGLRHGRDVLYAKLLPIMNRETLTTRATFP